MPAAGEEVEAGEGGDRAAEGVAHEHDFVVGMFLDGFCEMGEDDGAGVQPGAVEAGVDGAVLALRGVGGWWLVSPIVGRGGCVGGEGAGGRVGIGVVAGVGDVFLRDGGEVDDCVCERVGAAEGEEDAWAGGRVREGDVAAGVAEEGAGVPGL